MAMAKAFFAALPDMKHEITDIFAFNDNVVMRFVLRGTHKAELEGIPPTGKQLAVSAISVFRIKNGVIIEEREEADMAGMYQQLGLELERQARPGKIVTLASLASAEESLLNNYRKQPLPQVIRYDREGKSREVPMWEVIRPPINRLPDRRGLCPICPFLVPYSKNVAYGELVRCASNMTFVIYCNSYLLENRDTSVQART